MYDLAAAKLRLGITDAAQDEAIEQCLATGLALAERYCDRRFAFKRETVNFPGSHWPVLMVRRYPLARVYSMTVQGGTDYAVDLSQLLVHHEFGMVRGRGAGCSAGASIALDYEGGYKVLPPDLEFALWAIFDALWASTPGWGLPAGSSSDGSGAVRSFAIDGMSISYDTSDEHSSGAAGGDASAWGVIPSRAVAVLNLYRAETAVGGA